MQATLTDLQRKAGKLIRPVIHAGETLVITEHGQPCAQVVPIAGRRLRPMQLWIVDRRGQNLYFVRGIDGKRHRVKEVITHVAGWLAVSVKKRGREAQSPPVDHTK